MNAWQRNFTALTDVGMFPLHMLVRSCTLSAVFCKMQASCSWVRSRGAWHTVKAMRDAISTKRKTFIIVAGMLSVCSTYTSNDRVAGHKQLVPFYTLIFLWFLVWKMIANWSQNQTISHPSVKHRSTEHVYSKHAIEIGTRIYIHAHAHACTVLTFAHSLL